MHFQASNYGQHFLLVSSSWIGQKIKVASQGDQNDSTALGFLPFG